jgi:hypothetical protein
MFRQRSQLSPPKIESTAVLMAAVTFVMVFLSSKSKHQTRITPRLTMNEACHARGSGGAGTFVFTHSESVRECLAVRASPCECASMGSLERGSFQGLGSHRLLICFLRRSTVEGFCIARLRVSDGSSFR